MKAKEKIINYIIILSFIFPLIFTSVLCYFIGNIIPVLIIGSISFISVIVFFSKVDVPHNDCNSNKFYLGISFLSLFASSIILLISVPIYYIVLAIIYIIVN